MNFDFLSKKESGKRPLTVAFGKGRGFEECLRLVTVPESSEYLAFTTGAIPVYAAPNIGTRFVKVRHKDLPWLLCQGYIDVAIGSSIWFDEFLHPVPKQVAELPLMKCRLSVIAAKKIEVPDIVGICSKFQSISKQYIYDNGLKAKVMFMEGCHEVALSLGMTDAIIDVIDTGKTIRRMNFVELDCIKHITHGIWTREHDSSLNEKLFAMLQATKIPIRK